MRLCACVCVCVCVCVCLNVYIKNQEHGSSKNNIVGQDEAHMLYATLCFMQ